MTEQITNVSPRTKTRIAGLFYLINIIAGFFAIGYVPSVILVVGDAAATAQNILAHALLYRWGLVAHIVVILCNIPLAIIFYDLFKVVNKKLALFVVFFTLMGTAIEAANLLWQFVPLILLSGGSYLGVFTVPQLQALAYVPFGLATIGYSIQQVFYAFYILSASVLIWKSTFLPRALGVFMALGGLSYLFYSFSYFLSPHFASSLVPYIQAPSGLAEISLMFWLLIVGVNVEKWNAQAELVEK